MSLLRTKSYNTFLFCGYGNSTRAVYSHATRRCLRGDGMPKTVLTHRRHCNLACVRVFELALCANVALLVRISGLAPCCLIALTSASLCVNSALLYYFRTQAYGP